MTPAWRRESTHKSAAAAERRAVVPRMLPMMMVQVGTGSRGAGKSAAALTSTREKPKPARAARRIDLAASEMGLSPLVLILFIGNEGSVQEG
jgi:hypothetical protein